MPGNMKNLIADTFISLSLNKNIDKITVKDLVEACNISRQTFYYHFQDILQVIEWNVEQNVQKALTRSLQAETLEKALEIFLELAISKHDIIRRLLQSQQREHLEKLFTTALEEYLSGVFRNKIGVKSINADDLRILRSFYTYGVVGVLLDSSHQENPDIRQLARQLALLLSNTPFNIDKS